jgi:hypothetical protein
VNGLGLSGTCNLPAADDIIKREATKMSFAVRKTPWQAGDLLFLIEENEFGAYSQDLRHPVLGVYGRYEAGTLVVFFEYLGGRHVGKVAVIIDGTFAWAYESELRLFQPGAAVHDTSF